MATERTFLARASMVLDCKLKVLGGSHSMMACPARSRYDIEINKDDMDFATTRGFINGLKYTLRLKRGSLFWGGNPCSNQIFMSSSVHKRSADDPMGDMTQPSNSAKT